MLHYCRLLLSIQARIMVKSRCVFVSLLFWIVSRLNHFQLHLFMFCKVNVTLFRKFLGFYFPSKLGLWFNQDAFLYHYYLGLHQACITFSYICSCSVSKRYIIMTDSRLLLSIHLGLWLIHDTFLYQYYIGSFLDWVTFSYICSCSVR